VHDVQEAIRQHVADVQAIHDTLDRDSGTGAPAVPLSRPVSDLVGAVPKAAMPDASKMGRVMTRL